MEATLRRGAVSAASSHRNLVGACEGVQQTADDANDTHIV